MSNFMTNLISIQMTQRQVIELTNKLTVTQLKDIYKNAQNQYQVYSYKHNKNECVQAMESSAAEDFSNPNSLALAFDRTGKLFFYISASGMQLTSFPTKNALPRSTATLTGESVKAAFHLISPNRQRRTQREKRQANTLESTSTLKAGTFSWYEQKPEWTRTNSPAR